MASADMTRWATHSSDLESPKGALGSWRRRARSAALHLLTAPLLAKACAIPDHRPHLRIVYYHYICSDEQQRFATQLKFFRDYYDVVGLSEGLARLRTGQLQGPTLAITFDDGFKNNRTIAAEILAQHGCAACFYVATAFVTLTSAQRMHVEVFCRQNLRLPVAMPNMDWNDLQQLLKAGHEIGSHTVTHPALVECPDDIIWHEVVESKRILESELGRSVKHFSVPFGARAYYTANINHMVSRAGYQSCAYGVRGANLNRCDPFQLRRDVMVGRWSVREVRAHLVRTAHCTKPLGVLTSGTG